LQNDEFTLYSKFFNIINSSLPKPDLLVYLYLHVDRLKSNILKRGRSYEKNIKKSYLEKIQSGYFDYIKQQQNMRILIIDINKIDFVEKQGFIRII
jgi:deoxyadenosine/deoxycytidine kinase